LVHKDHKKDNFKLLEEVCHAVEVKIFEEKLEDLKAKTNVVGREWIRGLMPKVEKWSRAHDTGGWRHSFQTSSMAEIFNGLLKGVRGLHVIAIATYTFYKCVE
jgi:hypothetical protein